MWLTVDMGRCLLTRIEAIRSDSLPLDPGAGMRTNEVYLDLFETIRAPNHRYS